MSEVFTRIEICQHVATHTGRLLDPDDSFYRWLKPCLCQRKPFYSRRELKKFLFVSAYLELHRNLEAAQAALRVDIRENSHLYGESINVETFIEINPICCKACRQRSTRKSPAQRTGVISSAREPRLRYAG